MLLIWARAIIPGYMAVNESNHWHKACHSPVRIGSAVPISTIANRATSGWRLYHHQQQQNSGIRERCRTMKMKLRPSTFHLWWSWLWHKRNAQRRILHRVVYFFPTAATTTVISSPSTSGGRSREKISSMRRTLDPIHCSLRARSVDIWIELSRGLNLIASNPIRSVFLSD